MANMIDLFNSTVPKAINKYGSFYKVFVGDPDFAPDAVVETSEAVRCGALCNELEFARLQTREAASSFNVDNAEGALLDGLVMAHIDLLRRGTFEDDEEYRMRFKAVVTQKTNVRRHTRWAIIDAIRELGIDRDMIELVERFDSTNNYFEVRLIGLSEYSADSLFLDNNTTNGFLDQYYLGGVGMGYVDAFIVAIVQRVKAAGVDFDVLTVQRGIFTKTADARIE